MDSIPWTGIVIVLGWLGFFLLRDRRKAAEAAAPASGIEDLDLSWLEPPGDMHAAEPWDRFWHAQIEHKVAGFTDLFVDDRELLKVCEARGFTTALCVGAGLSLEPHALAAGGLQVTVLDIAPLVAEAVQGIAVAGDDLERLLDTAQQRPGGAVRCVTGDLTDGTLCPGPFDLIVERKTLQLFPKEERRAALEAIAARMAPNGVLFTQCHNGAWRPGEPRVHPLEPLLGPCGFAAGTLETAAAIEGRTAITFVTTG